MVNAARLFRAISVLPRSGQQRLDPIWNSFLRLSRRFDTTHFSRKRHCEDCNNGQHNHKTTQLYTGSHPTVTDGEAPGDSDHYCGKRAARADDCAIQFGRPAQQGYNKKPFVSHLLPFWGALILMFYVYLLLSELYYLYFAEFCNFFH